MRFQSQKTSLNQSSQMSKIPYCQILPWSFEKLFLQHFLHYSRTFSENSRSQRQILKPRSPKDFPMMHNLSGCRIHSYQTMTSLNRSFQMSKIPCCQIPPWSFEKLFLQRSLHYSRTLPENSRSQRQILQPRSLKNFPMHLKYCLVHCCLHSVLSVFQCSRLSLLNSLLLPRTARMPWSVMFPKEKTYRSAPQGNTQALFVQFCSSSCHLLIAGKLLSPCNVKTNAHYCCTCRDQQEDPYSNATCSG